MSRITRNTVGMFDCLKGAIVLFVVLSHCFIEVWAVNQCTDYTFIWRCVHSTTGVAMGVFFIISGYGFRPVKNLRGVKTHVRMLLRPILTAYICFTIVMLILNLIRGRSAFSGIANRWIGLLLGHMRRTEIFGLETETITVFWYFIALFASWMILSLIFHLFERESLRCAAVLLCSTAGCLLGRYIPELWFCITQSLLAVGFLYAGYLIKKKEIAFVKIPIWGYAILIGMTGFVLAFGQVNLGVGELDLGMIDYAGTICGSILVIRIYLAIFDPEWKIYTPFMFIGRNSALFICIHGFEALLILWRICPYLQSDHVQLMAFAFFACRFAFITALYYITISFRKLWNRTIKERSRLL